VLEINDHDYYVNRAIHLLKEGQQEPDEFDNKLKMAMRLLLVVGSERL